MRILVAITEVATPDDTIEFSDKSIIESNFTYGLNEWDEYAIEEAIQISESDSDSDSDVISVTIAPPRAEKTIRMALAKGVTKAIRVWDPKLELLPFLDPQLKAKIIAKVVSIVSPDIILTGVQSSNDCWGSTGVALAAEVGFNWATLVTDLELSGDVAHVRRELENGIDELAEVTLPAVFTIQTGINKPRYASLRGIKQAQQKELEVLSLSDLSSDPDEFQSKINFIEFSLPISNSAIQFFEGNPNEQAAQIATIIKDLGFGGG
jgi:electron transfer flavoprotein beta subunit